MSVANFCQHAQELQEEDNHAQFVKFVLTGKDGQGQAEVDPILDIVKDTEAMQLTRDYDSILGMCPDIKVLGLLTVCPLAKRDDTLMRNTHFTYQFEYCGLKPYQTSLNIVIHKVPNICLGKWGTHNMLRAFIPALYSEDCHPQLSQNEQRIFYKDGFLPAIKMLSPVSSTEWSPSYTDLMFAARRESGQLAFHTKVVPPSLVILHQIRGVKESTMHSVSYAAGNQLLTEDDYNTRTLTEAPKSTWIVFSERTQGKYETTYLQMYTTEKALIYSPEKGHFGKCVTCNQILKGKGDLFAENLYQLYLRAIQSKYSLTCLEMRIPLEFATTVFQDFDRELIQSSLLSSTLTVGGEGKADIRSSKQALLLTAACVWIINGIHSTPDMGLSSPDLMNAILPHVERKSANLDILAYGTPLDEDEDISKTNSEDDNDEPRPAKRCRDAVTLPAVPWGLLFHRDICVEPKHPVPCFVKEGDFISKKTFMYFFKVPMKNIRNHIVNTTLCTPIHSARIMNKQQRTTIFAPDDEPHDLFKLGNRGLMLYP
ncbi:hypothetical protein B0H34DRAFT_675652 [Crassisporium funariophilum]|nr:hypothetical protein B0H34DRAFT_675652 [Crassisporium funariophilum]